MSVYIVFLKRCVQFIWPPSCDVRRTCKVVNSSFCLLRFANDSRKLLFLLCIASLLAGQFLIFYLEMPGNVLVNESTIMSLIMKMGL